MPPVTFTSRTLDRTPISWGIVWIVTIIGIQAGCDWMAALETVEVCDVYDLKFILAKMKVGRFEWGGQEFTERARNISFDPDEGGSHVPVLRAELEDDAGRFLQGDVNLAERINNHDGYLQYSW